MLPAVDCSGVAGAGLALTGLEKSSLRKAERRMVAEPTGEPFRWAQTVSSDPEVLLFSKSIKGKEQSSSLVITNCP